MREPPLIVIAGGGVSGLATALALQDLAATRPPPMPRILVLEAEAELGGKVRTLTEDGFTCEWGVNGFLNKEPKTLELCQRLSLQDRLLPASSAYNKRYLFVRGRLRPVSMNPVKFLFSGLLPFAAKLRLMREPWVRTPAPEGDESVAGFATRRIGQVAFETLVDPMQTGIYAGDPERMSVQSCFPRVVEVEREYGSLIRGMMKLAAERRGKGEPLPGAGPSGHLTSFRGGMQVLIERLGEVLGAMMRRSSPVRQIQPENGSLRVGIEGQESLVADAVVLACPAHAASVVTQTLDRKLSELLAEIPYPPLNVVCLGYPAARVRHPLDGFGFLAPRRSGLRCLGALWASSTFPDNAPAGQVLIRVMVGGARDPGVRDLDDEELVRLVAEEMARVHGTDGAPSFVRVFRHPLAIPQYVIGHEERLRQIEERLAKHPGVFLAGNAYRGISVNDCARNAWPTAERVLSHLRSSVA